MKFGTYGILILFGLFILLLIFNPRVSCFGKRLRSPFYPLLRQKKKTAQPPAENYGFKLVEGEERKGKQEAGKDVKTAKKTDDYGFKLD